MKIITLKIYLKYSFKISNCSSKHFYKAFKYDVKLIFLLILIVSIFGLILKTAPKDQFSFFNLL